MNISSNKYCIECRACVQVCAKTAISMIPNEEGFSYPSVDTNACSDCGLCTTVCPILHAEELKFPTGSIYAAQSKDERTLLKSSSGGIFSCIAECVLKKNGIVYGAAWDESLQLRHIGVDSSEGLDKLRGSKYVHSEIGDTYKEIRRALSSGRWVYFVGTPCQVAGLKSFLRKNYDTLLTSDLICHGTPSQMLFNKFVSQMEKERGQKVIDYKFRDKKIMGWTCASSSSFCKDIRGNVHYLYYDRNMRAYFRAFLNGHITRYDCYECKFACPTRVGDITLADYWGIQQQHPEFPQIRKGVSLLIVNSHQGENILNEIKKDLVLLESSMDKVRQTTNHNLYAPTPKPEGRKDSYKLAKKDFIAFRDLYLKGDKPEGYFRKIYIKKRIKQLPLLNILFRSLGKD
ncbi:MAG: Coenzyme F420 hydrogenase/dehydrogenase, beta subunit C-terminal domain [Paludibacteraceae bacterium]|nr:Coenzyme F420 hydrogenase/dehydrogenase, beta subunit C-terminal domain [Paludibacteraceae bacterium]